LNFEELRHFIAHGLLIVTPYPGDATLQYRLYRTTKQGVEIGFMEMSSSQLTDVSLRITELLHQVLKEFRSIYADLKLEFEG